MRELEKSEVKKLLGIEKFTKIMLLNVNYFESETSPNYLSYTMSYQGNDDIFIAGRIFAEIDQNGVKLLPSFIDLCTGVEIISVNWNEVIDISYGKNVKLDIRDGYYIIQDKFEREIALCEIKNQICSPIIDIGYYIRGEEK